MKLRFALLLVTCGMLFPQPKGPTPAQCLKDCQGGCATVFQLCQKSAKTDKDKKACEANQISCSSKCPKACGTAK